VAIPPFLGVTYDDRAAAFPGKDLPLKKFRSDLVRWGIATPACGLVRDDRSCFLQFPTDLQIPIISLLNI